MKVADVPLTELELAKLSRLVWSRLRECPARERAGWRRILDKLDAAVPLDR